MSAKDYVQLSVKFIRSTAAAYLLFDYYSETEIWVPSSMASIVEGDAEPDCEVIVEMPEWLAKKKGMI